MAAFKLKALAAGVLIACGLTLGVGPGWVANGQEKPKATLPGKPADTRKRELEREVEALNAAILKAQAELAKLATPQPEFKYVPLRNDGVVVSRKDFESIVADNEKGGYTFTGCVPLAPRNFTNQEVEFSVPTLVFRKKAEPPKPVAVVPQATPEKLYAVNFDNVPWPKVAEWLVKETGLTPVGDVAPQGTCTIKLDRKISIGELMDLFNDVLAQQKLILVRGEQTLRFWPADKPIPQLYVPPVRVEDLPKYGKSEIVSVVVPLNGITAEDAEKLAKKLKSPLGEAVIGKNQLIIRDRAGAVRAVIATLEEPQKKPDAGQQPNPVRIPLKNSNAVGAAVRAAAAIKYADRPNALNVEVNWAVVKLSGDDDAVKWATELVENLTK